MSPRHSPIYLSFHIPQLKKSLQPEKGSPSLEAITGSTNLVTCSVFCFVLYTVLPNLNRSITVLAYISSFIHYRLYSIEVFFDNHARQLLTGPIQYTTTQPQKPQWQEPWSSRVRFSRASLACLSPFPPLRTPATQAIHYHVSFPQQAHIGWQQDHWVLQ